MESTRRARSDLCDFIDCLPMLLPAGAYQARRLALLSHPSSATVRLSAPRAAALRGTHGRLVRPSMKGGCIREATARYGEFRHPQPPLIPTQTPPAYTSSPPLRLTLLRRNPGKYTKTPGSARQRPPWLSPPPSPGPLLSAPAVTSSRRVRPFPEQVLWRERTSALRGGAVGPWVPQARGPVSLYFACRSRSSPAGSARVYHSNLYSDNPLRFPFHSTLWILTSPLPAVPPVVAPMTAVRDACRSRQRRARLSAFCRFSGRKRSTRRRHSGQGRYDRAYFRRTSCGFKRAHACTQTE